MKEGMNLQLEVNSLSLNVPEFDLILFTNLFALHHKPKRVYGLLRGPK